MAAALGQQVGQTVIVQDMGGAGGALGANAVAKAEPDGYTFLFAGRAKHRCQPCTSTCRMTQRMTFVGVSLVAQFPLVMVVSPKLPAKRPS